MVLAVGRSERGFSLPEVIVASSVLVLLVAAALACIVPAIRVSRTAEQSTSAQREVVLALDRLVTELAELDRASVTVEDQVLSFLSHQEYRGANSPLPDNLLHNLNLRSLHDTWRKTVILRHRDNALWRREYPYLKGNELTRVLPARLIPEADRSGVSELKFADTVEDFEAVEVGGARLSLRLRAVNRAGAQPQSCEMTVQVKMRGGA